MSLLIVKLRATTKRFDCRLAGGRLVPPQVPLEMGTPGPPASRRLGRFAPDEVRLRKAAYKSEERESGVWDSAMAATTNATFRIASGRLCIHVLGASRSAMSEMPLISR